MYVEKKMNLSLLMALFVAAMVVVAGCGKKEEPVKKGEPTTQTPAEPVKEEAKAPEVKVPEVAAKVEEAAKAAGDLVAIPLELPKPMFQGTPQNIQVEKLEQPTGKARPAFLAPAGVELISRNKPVKHVSDEFPLFGELEMIVDGDKEATDDCLVELGSDKQGIQIDLQDEYEIYAIVVWHFHKTARVYFDVAVQVSTDEDFVNAKTVFNNDLDNTLGLGVGQDWHYVETNEGRLFDAKGVKGRYVRLYSNGNNQNDLSHYVEVEVFGKKAN